MMLRKWILVSVLSTMLVGCGDYSSGDRVLVCKPSYDNGIVGPRRYEVVVFKYPSGPVERNTPKNYIKRLLGLPGELIAIFFGRVYHRVPTPNAPPFYDDANRVDDGKKHDPVNFWKSDYMHFDDAKSRTSFEAGEFEILRKPPHIMMAMRRIVYDNDFQAKDLKGKLDRWNPRAKSGWKNDATTGFVNSGANADIDWLRYQHLERPNGPMVPGVQPKLITDSLDYNNFQVLNGGHVADRKPFNAYWVGDLMLECNVEVVEAKGEFWFELSKGINRFRAKWDLATGECTLFREELGKKVEVKIESQPTNVKAPGNYVLRFANIDARLAVWVDRDLPFGDGKDYDPPEVRSKNDPKDVDLEKRRGPTANDLEPASVGSKNANVKVTHLRLWRDTYYTTFKDANGHQMADYDLNGDDWANPARWEPIRKARYVTMFVQPNHYLCLGDNSQASSDSRDWGVVPDRLMLGRALVVYFPLDRMGPIR